MGFPKRDELDATGGGYVDVAARGPQPFPTVDTKRSADPIFPSGNHALHDCAQDFRRGNKRGKGKAGFRRNAPVLTIQKRVESERINSICEGLECSSGLCKGSSVPPPHHLTVRSIFSVLFKGGPPVFPVTGLYVRPAETTTWDLRVFHGTLRAQRPGPTRDSACATPGLCVLP